MMEGLALMAEAAAALDPDLGTDDELDAERERLHLEEQAEFEKHSKWRQAILAHVEHQMGRNEAARIYKVHAGELTKYGG